MADLSKDRWNRVTDTKLVEYLSPFAAWTDLFCFWIVGLGKVLRIGTSGWLDMIATVCGMNKNPCRRCSEAEKENAIVARWLAEFIKEVTEICAEDSRVKARILAALARWETR